MSLCSAKFFARLAAALVAGAAIGVERQWHQKMAGLRTNSLVVLGSAGFVAFSSVVGQGDPTRVAAQVVSGIGFLGAGVILREGANVRGLKTAATLWCSAMVGTFAGGGCYALSLGAPESGKVCVTADAPLGSRKDAALEISRDA
jgi:putative Mg2+ transporter-C (MgtC) family protein